MESVLLVSSDLDERALLSAALAAPATRVVEAAYEEGLDALIEREQIALAILIEQQREDAVLDWALGALARHAQLHLVVVFDSDAIDERRTQLDAEPRALSLSRPFDAAQLAHHVAAMLAPDPDRAPLDERPSERLIELQREFARELPGRLQKIAALLERVRGDAGAAAEGAMLAHRLRGSAAAYGFGALGQAAGELEDVLNKRAAAPLSRGDFAQLELALSDMIATAQSAPRSLLYEGTPRSYLGLSPLLVLDDDAEFVRRVRFLARAQFLDSIVARHPRAALQHAQRTPPIAVLVGARYEREFGGLCGKLRKVSGRAGLPVVLATPGPDLALAALLGDLPGALLVSRASSDAELTEVLRKLAFARAAPRQRVLLLSEDAAHGQRLAAALARLPVELEVLARPEQLLELLQASTAALVWIDLAQPSGSGLDVCRLLRRSARHQHLAIVVASDTDDARLRTLAYRAGASDFVSKLLDAEELEARAAVRLAESALLQAQAEKDGLTGLLNLRPFLEAGERALARARRAADPVAVALLDIDGLAAINGSHGHVAADDAIAQLGRLVAERFRASDLRCRWAGGQFALLFDGAGKQDIAAALKRLLADFGGCRFQAQGALAFRATLSGGVAAFPEDGESLHALLTGADQRLARAKRAGGGQLWSSDAAPLGKEPA